MGESQNPHLNQGGKAAVQKRALPISLAVELWKKKECLDLHRGRMKPPKMNISTKITEPTVVATTIVRKTEAMKRHMDVDA